MSEGPPTFLVDESLPRGVATALAAAGYDAVDARDCGLGGAADSVVFAEAVSQGRALVTADLDFANPLRFLPDTHSGIIVVRIRDSVTVKERAARVVACVESFPLGALAGTLVTIDTHRVRFFGRGPAR